MENLKESAERINSDGFILLPDLGGRELVESIRETSDRRSRKIRAALGTRDIGIGSAAGFIEIVQRSPGRWDVPITLDEFSLSNKGMPWWPLITAILGDDAEDSFSGVVSSDAGTPAQYWHTDSPHEAQEHRPAHALNVLLALQDVSLNMGPTECARGSHLLTNHLENESLVLDELVYQHAGTSPELLVKGKPEPAPEARATALTAGTCLVFDDRLLHRGLANQSGDTRHVAYFSYCTKGYVGETHFESDRSVFDT
jgi:hypothetical protein